MGLDSEDRIEKIGIAGDIVVQDMAALSHSRFVDASYLSPGVNIRAAKIHPYPVRSFGRNGLYPFIGLDLREGADFAKAFHPSTSTQGSS
jgi:hypothetical protein